MSQKSGRSSPSPKEDDTQLQVPPTRSSRSSTSSQPDVGPQTRSAGLPTNLKLKVATQMSKLQLMKDIFSKLSNVSTWTVQDLSHTQEQLQDLHKNFSKTHSIVNPLQSLKALGEDLEQNNNLLVFHIINRMDHASRTHWETLISSNNEFPSFAQLMEFLQSRSRALEWTESNQRQSSQESSRSRTTVHTISQKVTAQSKPSPSLISSKSASSNTPISKVSSMPSYTCDDCGHDHFIADCPRFSKRSPQEKADVVLHRILCSNCLGRHHRHSCRTTKICKICGSRHHTLLHDAPLSSKPHCKVPPVPPRVLPQSALTSQKSAQRELPLPRLNILLATAIAHLITSTGSHTVRLLIDTGSELTFISQDLARKLNISRRKSHVVIVGSLALTLKSTYDHQTINIDAHILSSSFSNLPSFYICFQQSLHLQHLKLADPEYHISRAIDIILDADVYGSVVLPQMKKGPPSSPIAQLSIFGWLILGPVCQEQERLPIHSPMFHTISQQSHMELDQLHFWQSEFFSNFSKMRVTTFH
ncbi:uncharacterized protein LOC123313949 [Coccinella septempunctata]|uniref:uncharacterized protein LOC123313949 n=1 Tax=Coccinella septempunctata TaxID=41139 RepID=UPI001D0920AD|nr:uncharacterized protein LOC123313949 [Coccinella septempunctata]